MSDSISRIIAFGGKEMVHVDQSVEFGDSKNVKQGKSNSPIARQVASLKRM
jgi:hypothetical protein